MGNHFQTKFFFGFVAILILIGAFYLFNLKNYKSTTLPVNTMSGYITEVRKDSIVVAGLVGTEDKIVELAIIPETIFKNSIIGITAEQAKSGKPFKPQMQIVTGIFSDLIKDMNVRVITEDNLLKTSKAVVKEIRYISHDYQF